MKKPALSVFLIIIVTAVLPAYLSADGMGMIDPDLIGTWKWQSAETPAGSLTPVGDKEYTVTFTEDGRVHMQFEVNVINGTYEADGNVLTIIPPMAMTMASWQPGSPAPALLKLLEKSRDYTVSSGSLSITASAAAGTMEFQRQ